MEIINHPDLISNLLLVLIVTFCGITDILYQKIYNYITIPLFIFGFGFNIINSGFDGFLFSCGGFIPAFFLFFFIYLIGGPNAMGAGDVKLMSAIGALKGFAFMLNGIFVITILGALLAVIFVIIKGKLIIFLKNLHKSLFFFTRRGGTVKKDESAGSFSYGIAIAFGILILIIFEDIIQGII